MLYEQIENKLEREVLCSVFLEIEEILATVSQVMLEVKNLPANAGDARDSGSIPGWGRPPGVGSGHPLQYSCLGNPMDRGVWQATVRRVIKSQTHLSDKETTC